jgi:hypothetical protein
MLFKKESLPSPSRKRGNIGMMDATLRHVHATIVAAEKQYYMI